MPYQYVKRSSRLEEKVENAVLDAIEGTIPVDSLIRLSPGAADLTFTPLMLAASYRQTNRNFGTNFGARHVQQLLAKGADVNFKKPADRVTALAVAVIYSNYEVVDMLIKAGADPLSRDNSGRNALSNTVGFPDMRIVNRLLQEGCSAAERVNEELVRTGNNSFGDGFEGFNVAEMMLISPEARYGSWKVYGRRPKADAFLECFHTLLLHGADLNRETQNVLSNLLTSSGEHFRRIAHLNYDLALAYLGLKFPSPKPRAKWTEAGEKTERQSGRLTVFPPNDSEADEFAQGRSLVDQLNNQMFVNRFADLMQQPEVHGVTAMSAEQLLLECQALGLDVTGIDPSDKDTLAEKIETHEEKARSRQASAEHSTYANGERHRNAGQPFDVNIHVETGSSAATYNEVNAVLIPTLGPSCIQVKVNGMPVAAYLSTVSTVSLVPVALANQLGIPYSNMLKSSSFKSGITGEDINGISLIREITITLSEDVSVTLKNAVCVPQASNQRLQLGMDFFCQALRSSISVLIGGNTRRDAQTVAVVAASRGSDMFTYLENTDLVEFKETFRYYMPNNKTVVLPVMHIHDTRNPFACTICIKPTAAVHYCDWCARVFPGLKRCSGCTNQVVYYCSRACQKAAWPTHKLTHQ